MQTGKAHGMYLLEQSLNELVAKGRITREVALSLARRREALTPEAPNAMARLDSAASDTSRTTAAATCTWLPAAAAFAPARLGQAHWSKATCSPTSLCASMMQELASEKLWSQYVGDLDLDFAYSLEGVARFRANYFVQERGAAASSA
jgi:Tfp pilus assembly pilus retraction ATPase PilT